ncbi:glycosyltransferase [archaeon]
MKICYFADASSIHTHRWLSYFSGKGHEVHLVSLEKKRDDLDWRGVKFHHVKDIGFKKALLLPYYAPKFKKIVRGIKPEVLHAHYATKYGFLAHFTGFHPLVVTAWGSDVLLDPKDSWFTKVFLKMSLPKAEALTCDGSNTTNALTGLGVKPENIHRIYFGIDTKRFVPRARSEQLRKKLDLGNNPTIISLRTLEPLYSIDTLLKAVPLVLEKVPRAKFLVCGNGPQEQELKELAKTLGVEKSVNFVGRLSGDELPKYLASSDIYVSTSLSDSGLAASTGEAIACGLPAITTPSGDAKSMLGDKGRGIITPMKKPKVLAKNIVRVIKDKKLRNRLVDAGRDYILNVQAYNKNMRKMEQIYEGLLK